MSQHRCLRQAICFSKLHKYKNQKNIITYCFLWLFLVFITILLRREHIIKTHGKYEISCKNMRLQIFSLGYLLAKTAK